MRIRAVEVYKSQIPLTKAYHTAFGDLPYFDTILAIIYSENAVGVGESCPVYGYCWEKPDEAWQFVKEHGEKLVGEETEACIEQLRPYLSKFPYSVTPLLTALEQLAGRFPRLEKDMEFPLAGILNITRREEVQDAVTSLLEQGYTTIKFKVGFDPEEDIVKVRSIQGLLEGKALLRLDANQSFSFDQALKFVKSIDPQGIELFEQPFPIKEWEAMRKFAPLSPIRLMLDESIYGEDDIERTSTYGCAQLIKLKLMKVGSFERLISQSQSVLKNGLGLVIGNGVASDIGCYQEAVAALHLGINTAGEMNGYLKLREPLVPGLLLFNKGKTVLRTGLRMEPDRRILEKYTKAEARWSE
jgi:L-alanine-DL-glutamate epimerase-like enolase superfamily enzyme